MNNLSLVSWNVNGLRAIIKKGFITSLKSLDPDILCLQETKGQVEDIKTALQLLPDYKAYVNCSKLKKGYSGTAILSKKEPLDITYDLGHEEHDQEGRVITAEFDHFFLVNVYTPNSGQGLNRLEYRQAWDVIFLNHLRSLEQRKPVVLCGDLNVAHEEIDIARAKQNYNKSAGYTQQEIDGFKSYLEHGFVDTFRHFFPEEVKYTYWNQMFNSRARNVGWRIDYFLVSPALLGQVKTAAIHDQFHGSDHCPVELVLYL
ncbi:Exodeoxyribonuclease III [Fulvivirga imtechensis AK7]|uniref:Exodeoxyribonuclease III n=1 Tax=Fulvivirga imtechensis AK7 TaxID=1237149 RepID=L8JSA1_9BACT|nr:exodeoxyribonuclease III [Fulvivirga imtechensis]ELR70364.1 Exodeoxyribonuclease III [Fulvivirga imtechensis AK7]